MEITQVIKKIGEYWDERSLVFDKEHDTEDLEAWKSTLVYLLGDDKNRSVLDLGTGTGFMANMTSEMGYATIGMDISKEMMKIGVRHANSAQLNAIYMEGSALLLPFMDDTIDYIINTRLLWTLVEADAAIKEWSRVIKPGGKIYCFNRMKEGVGLTSNKVNVYNDEDVNAHLEIKGAEMKDLIELLERNGLVDVRIEKLPGLTRPGYDYEPWFVLMGTKPISQRQIEAIGIAEFWNKSASDYEKTHQIDDHNNWKDTLKDLIGEKKEQKILDVATGTGIIANLLGQAGYANVSGIDLSERMMAIAVEHAKECQIDVSYKLGNALELPFEDETFDIIINSRLLWTLTEPEAAIREWKRVLKPGGKLIAINELEPEFGIRCDNIADYQKEIRAKELPYSNIDQNEILEKFKECDLKDVEIKPMKGCRLINSDRENWYAFIGLK
ncbi:class I SAM-dependent methyltransferase [Acetobacterium wieringae]|uniref:Class I SAM-dependent methyltransferase n=2 Tax=Acetobacterium wieringae TaxID=52694 RepID=A0ABY6HH24_9FIRM|nr:class I SAM-dependent methyltransferase [Acetobacterium wieringae]VUZ26684.1 Ubiquinone/menaquinone biosynthesis C-methyltransferase UbiE [Acetobacterium wieringae]